MILGPQMSGELGARGEADHGEEEEEEEDDEEDGDGKAEHVAFDKHWPVAQKCGELHVLVLPPTHGVPSVTGTLWHRPPPASTHTALSHSGLVPEQLTG